VVDDVDPAAFREHGAVCLVEVAYERHGSEEGPGGENGRESTL
jgi:hypothetical protein